MNLLQIIFPVAGIKTYLFIPPAVAFTISFFTSMAGISGAFLLLPFQIKDAWAKSSGGQEKSCSLEDRVDNVSLSLKKTHFNFKNVIHSLIPKDKKGYPLVHSIQSSQEAKDAVSAMIMAKSHLEKLECYACHSTWAPQRYGCHVKADYSEGQKSVDWIASGNIQLADGHTAESRRDGKAVKGPGKAIEARGYLRWENPVLGINGERRVSPIIPGCQQITTVIGPDGKPIVLNKIWRTAANLENGGPEGQRVIDMAPAAPHTRARQARSCASCHTNRKALGYGTHDGRYMSGKPNSLCRSKLGCPKDWIRTHNGAYAPLWFWFYRN